MSAPTYQQLDGAPQAEAPELATLSAAETAKVVARVLLPLTARGAIKRRPAVVRWLERHDLDRGAVNVLRELRDAHDGGPLRLSLPGRELAIIVRPDDVQRVLDGTPEPFAIANLEKRAALATFQPHNSLISHPPERRERRRFQEQVLRSEDLFHPVAEHLATIVAEEIEQLVRLVGPLGRMDWDDFLPVWYRIVRRAVFGDVARDDDRLTDDLADLRDRANLSYLAPDDPETRERFHRRLRAHLQRAEPGSLAGTIAELTDTDVDAAEQIPQWLFAFEPAGMATYRGLALLAAHGRRPVDGDADGPVPLHGDLRATVLESLRLWPTTPAILRDTTVPTEWRGRTLPSGTGVLVFAPLFHRDPDVIEGAHEFRPQRWDPTQPRDRAHDPLVPFSAGPGTCPGRNVVLTTCSLALHELWSRLEVRLHDPARLDPADPLPSVLDPFTLAFDVQTS